MASQRFEMRIPSELMERIDETRGHEPRASFIRRQLEAAVALDSLERRMDQAATDTRESLQRGLADAKAGRFTDGPPSLRDTWRR